MSRLTRGYIIALLVRGYHPLRPSFPDWFRLSLMYHWPGPRSLATTNGVSIDVLSSRYLDVSVPWVRLKPPILFGSLIPSLDNRKSKTSRSDFFHFWSNPKTQGLGVPAIEGGFPHSEIHGSKPIPGSPWLIAGYHVLHRLLLPRHPPNALIALDLIRKKKDLRPQGAAFCCPHPSLPIKSMYVSRPFQAEGTFAPVPCRTDAFG